jgi:hypothetical protein
MDELVNQFQLLEVNLDDVLKQMAFKNGLPSSLNEWELMNPVLFPSYEDLTTSVITSSQRRSEQETTHAPIPAQTPSQPARLMYTTCGKTGHTAQFCKDDRSLPEEDPAFNFMQVSRTSALAHKPTSFDWLVDSGADFHVCNDRTKFYDFCPSQTRLLRSCFGQQVKSQGTGSVRVLPTLTLKNVSYVPDMTNNIFSCDQGWADDDLLFIIGRGLCSISSFDMSTHHGVFYTRADHSKQLSVMAASHSWASRISYLPYSSLEKAVYTRQITGVNTLDNSSRQCEPMVTLKPLLSYPPLTHFDAYFSAPFSTPSLSSKMYCVLLFCKSTLACFLVPLHSLEDRHIYSALQKFNLRLP